MNANELRIGNYIVSRNGEVKKVENIQKNSFNQIIDSDDVSGSYLLSHYSGIPLSPEILEKCGFELNRNNELSIEINDIASHLELMSGAGGFYYPSFTQTPQGDEERTVYFNRINSLHQLQNLIYTLSGDELTYKQ